MYKNVIRPRLYHLATVGHKEEFEQLQIDNEKQAKRIQELETVIENILKCGNNPMWSGLHKACEEARQALKG